MTLPRWFWAALTGVGVIAAAVVAWCCAPMFRRPPGRLEVVSDQERDLERARVDLEVRDEELRAAMDYDDPGDQAEAVTNLFAGWRP